MLDPASVTVGAAIGIVAFTALSFALASRKDRKAREQMQRLAALKQAEYDVQDAAVLLVMDPPTGPVTRREAADDWQANRRHRNDMCAAYFAAMGG